MVEQKVNCILVTGVLCTTPTIYKLGKYIIVNIDRHLSSCNGMQLRFTSNSCLGKLSNIKSSGLAWISVVHDQGKGLLQG